jgi:MFS family permease
LIPSIAADSHVSLSTAQWLLTISLMTGALSTPVFGKLSDGPHQKEVTTIALGVVFAGSVLAALTSTFALLVIARGMQGLALGLLPVTMAIARRHLPGQQAVKAIAVLSVTAAVGVGLGYPVTGLLADVADYHLAYWFGALMVALTCAASLIVLPGKSPVASKPFDVFGASMLIVAVIALIVMLSQAADWGWSSPRTLGLLGVGVVVAAIWARYELRRAHPLVELRQTRNRMVLTADLAGLLISVAMYLYVPITVEFIQVPRSAGFGFGASVMVAGCALIPLSVGTLVASRLAVIYEQRFGRRSVIPVGAVVFAVSFVFFAVEHRSLWEAILSMALSGIGVGFTYAAMPGFIVRSVPVHETGSALGFYQILRSLGLAVGSALSAVVLAAYTPSGSLLPSVNGFRAALLLGALLCLFTAVLTWVLPGKAPAVMPADVMEQAGEVEGSGLMLAES